MDCKYTWRGDLPKQISDLVGSKILWFNLPKRLDAILENLKTTKPTCYAEIYPQGHKRFLWFTLIPQLNKLCELETCVE